MPIIRKNKFETAVDFIKIIIGFIAVVYIAYGNQPPESRLFLIIFLLLWYGYELAKPKEI